MLGLGLAEGKQVVARLQREIVLRQFEAPRRRARDCAQCGEAQSIKDYHGARFRSLFGDIDLRVPRHVKCGCVEQPPADGSVSAPRRRWMSAELECVQSELAATLPYERSAQILRMLLPIGRGNSASTVRDRTLRVGQRLESEMTTAAPVGPADADRSTVTTVGLDGGFVHHCSPGSTKSFEIIAGRILAKAHVQVAANALGSIQRAPAAAGANQRSRWPASKGLRSMVSRLCSQRRYRPNPRLTPPNRTLSRRLGLADAGQPGGPRPT